MIMLMTTTMIISDGDNESDLTMMTSGGSRVGSPLCLDQNQGPQGRGAEILRLPTLFSRAASNPRPRNPCRSSYLKVCIDH